MLLGSECTITQWQYPAITEGAAFNLHVQQGARVATVPEMGSQHYLGAPWATYIDKGSVPASDKAKLRARVEKFRKVPYVGDGRGLNEVWLNRGWPRIHTVCQHIYWQRLLSLWREIGITDLHLSHLEPDVQLSDISLHSWHLAAANVINEERRSGLVFGKPANNKKYLASFIGAHMPHYRSNVRQRLHEEVTRDGFHDVLYELKDEWHFNPLVYQRQVRGKPLDAAQIEADRAATLRYNAVLSDSVFALCPEGAGPNTIRLWEALAVGAIPVVIVEHWVWPTIPGKDLSWNDAVIHVKRDEIACLFDRLRWMRRFESIRVHQMQAAAMEVYRRFETKRCF